MNDIINKIGLYGIVPVVRIALPDDALPLARALCSAGLPVMEITYRTDYAEGAIRTISENIPNMLVGAGTVLDVAHAKSAKAAGAKFIVTPNTDPSVITWCQENDMPVLPGCATPSDVAAAAALGLDAVKFFPAEAMGGISTIKAMSGPFGSMKYLPTGGINADNMLDYLKNPRVLAVGGTFMVSETFIRNGQFDRVETMTRDAMMRMYGFSLAHIGINCADESSAKRYASLMTAMFGLSPSEDAGAVFTGGLFEFMKSPYLGRSGHIAVGTNFLDRAIFRFEQMGFTFNEDELKYNDKGELRAAYFNDEFFGFAFHLLQK